jgi:hypothetical protein
VLKIDCWRGRDRLVGHGPIASQRAHGRVGQPQRRAPIAYVNIVLDALLDEWPFEERVRWSQVRASAIDLTPVTAPTDKNEAVI